MDSIRHCPPTTLSFLVFQLSVDGEEQLAELMNHNSDEASFEIDSPVISGQLLIQQSNTEGKPGCIFVEERRKIFQQISNTISSRPTRWIHPPSSAEYYFSQIETVSLMNNLATNIY